MRRVLEGIRRWVWIPVLALSAGGFAWGLATGGFETVKSWFDQTCMSCIGLTWR